MATVKSTDSLLEGVDSTHTEYSLYENDWQLISDIKEGERQVKSQGTLYLPKLQGQDDKEYKAYLQRGVFYNATARTVSGLTGAIMRKPAVIEAPNKIEGFFDSITPDGYNIQETIKSTAESLLTYGRHGILVDFNDLQEVYYTEYTAQEILNWRTELIDGKKVLTFLTLSEIDERQDPDDEFNTNYYEQIRVLKLDSETGYLVVNLFERQVADTTAADNNKKVSEGGWTQVAVSGENKDHYPTKMGGEKLDYIPFVFFGAVRNTADINKAPLLDLSYVNIGHWKVTCDYYHGLHFCALPTPYALGIRSKENFNIGPSVAIVSENEQAKVGMLEFTGQGLSAVRDALKDLESKMAVLGARLLEEQKRAAEAAETLVIRSAGDSATLSSISGNLDRGFEEAILYTMLWFNLPETEASNISVKCNKDFVAAQLASSEITALLKALQTGNISQRTFLYQMKQGEILPDNWTIDDEMEEIEVESYTPFLTSRTGEEDLDDDSTVEDVVIIKDKEKEEEEEDLTLKKKDEDDDEIKPDDDEEMKKKKKARQDQKEKEEKEKKTKKPKKDRGKGTPPKGRK